MKYPLETAHTGLCAPMQTPYLASNFYFLTFIDDYNWKTWVYLLKHKYEAFFVSKIFNGISGEHIKILRLDRGGEHMIKKLI